VLIGASVYAGGIQKEVDRFCETFQEELAGRPVGLYLSCLYKGADAERQLADAFPPWLLTHAFGRYLVGGRVRLSELRLLDRVLFTRIAGVKRDVDEVDHQEIERMVADTQAQLSGLGA
jgi:menaquinone-dependent protoporphyrinogen IX oxidase